MQAILVADYSFTPIEYWRGVSLSAREFIKRCLTIDPNLRMTAHEALSHPWIAEKNTGGEDGEGDLLPIVKKNFNARRTLHAAIDTIRAIYKLREGGDQGMMNGATSRNPDKKGVATSAPVQEQSKEDKFTGEGCDKMEIDGRGHGRGQTAEMIAAQQRLREAFGVGHRGRSCFRGAGS